MTDPLTPREQATEDRHQSERALDQTERRANRRADANDLVELGNVVSELRDSVADLHLLILDSLTKAEAAEKAAEAAADGSPGKKKVYVAGAALLVLVLALAGIALYARIGIQNEEDRNRQVQLENCLIRNDAARYRDDQLMRIQEAIDRAATKGSVLAKELDSILVPNKPIALPDCARIVQ